MDFNRHQSLYNYTFVLPMEDQWAATASTEWMQQNWHYSITLSILYAISIYFGQKFMSERPAFELSKLLIFWNAGLAVFSIVGAVRISPEFYHIISNYGFRHSICISEYIHISVSGFWTLLFTFSKALELIDTAFIILRKRPLIFLHWYHHITVLIYTWFAYKDHTAAGRWYMWMNFHVHAFMYSYYALRSAGFRFPKFIPMAITSMQLMQMIIGCIIAMEVYKTKSNGQFCQQTYENLYFSSAIYFTYLLLFAKFFYNAYLRKRSHKIAQYDTKQNMEMEKDGDMQKKMQ